MRHIHFIGIGGAGLSAIARVLLERGYTVSGSDRASSPLFDALTAAGVKTFVGHAPEQVAGADIVVRSSSISNNNPEVLAACNAGIPVVKRADFLSELISDKETLAIAGSHGKTTTTAMLAWTMDQMGLHPSFISGGIVKQLGSNARSGTGPYFIIEADEYDYMFLGLSSKVAVITNIEHDHPDCFPTEKDYIQAFSDFLDHVQPDGLALICRDDPNARALMDSHLDGSRRILGYGLSKDAHYQADAVQYVDGFPQFNFQFRDLSGAVEKLGEVRLSVPGQHNVVNATVALSVIHQLGLPIDEGIPALKTFTGAGRRFEILGKAKGITIIDDYGHHPTEIDATLQAAKSRFPGRRIFAVWQPHTYTRTHTLENAFISSLRQADRVVITRIFGARELDPGYSAEKIAKALPDEMAVYLPENQEIISFLLDNLVSDDVVIFFSAGDATQISRDVFELLKENSIDKEIKS